MTLKFQSQEQIKKEGTVINDAMQKFKGPLKERL